jgi:hypothetical protein
MTRFFRFPYYSHIVKKREISSSLITKMTRITRKLIKTTYKIFKQSPKFFAKIWQKSWVLVWQHVSNSS